MNFKSKLTVQHDDNGSFADYSNLAYDYLRDPFTLDLVAAEDRLFVGFYKPFNVFYVAMATPNANVTTLTGEYWNGTTWASLELTDETRGLTRDGFISWDKSNMVTTSVNGVDKFYIRFTPDVDSTSIVVSGMHIIFSDDNELKQEFFEIDNANILPAGESSHIASHVAARNQIIQEFKSKGYIKDNATTGLESITPWDLNDITEVRQAATHLALAKIFFNLSDSPDDNWFHKYRSYWDRYQESMRIAHLSVDTDDDGVDDVAEKKANTAPFTWNR